MARELGDVLHYFIPEADREEPPSGLAPERAFRLAIPIGEQDVVRAAFVWNLAVELTRLGAAASVVAPAAGAATLWPAAELGPLGTELVVCSAADAHEFARAVEEIARTAATRSKEAFVLACPPAAWLEAEPSLLDPTLLFTTPDPSALGETGALLRRMLRAAPAASLGITVHGVDAIEPARRAFHQLAGTCERELGRELVSYGLLVDDLHVYRAIAELRPLGLTKPQSRGARALRDVARLLLEDARATSHA